MHRVALSVDDLDEALQEVAALTTRRDEIAEELVHRRKIAEPHAESVGTSSRTSDDSEPAARAPTSSTALWSIRSPVTSPTAATGGMSASVSVSAPRIEYGAPVNAFISVNEDVVHGLPTARPFRPGDVVKLDVTPHLDGFVADAAVTVVVPPATELAERLVACAEAAFWRALAVAKAGRPLNAIGQAVDGGRAAGIAAEEAGREVGTAGADIGAMKSFDYMDAYKGDYITRNWETIRSIRKPVIAAVSGFALGGGCELAMMADFIIASDKANKRLVLMSRDEKGEWSARERLGLLPAV